MSLIFLFYFTPVLIIRVNWMTNNSHAKYRMCVVVIHLSSLPKDVLEIARAIRGHWVAESYHWHLDVTFREDEKHTLEKQSAFNLNIIRKLALHVLKIYDTGQKKLSLMKWRFAIGTNPENT